MFQLASLPLEAEAGRACTAARDGDAVQQQPVRDRPRDRPGHPDRGSADGSGRGQQRRARRFRGEAAGRPPRDGRQRGQDPRRGCAARRKALGDRQGGRQEGEDRPHPQERAASACAGTLLAPASTGRSATVRGTEQAKPARSRTRQVNAYRSAHASYYGPGLYGNSTACGRTLTPSTVGVANKSLPCGTKVTFRYRGRTVNARVIDRGPFAGNREWDLTAALKAKLGFGSTGVVLSTR